MSDQMRRIRNFRISNALDEQLKAAAELVGADPSTLLRDFVRDGTSLIAKSEEVQRMLRQRYS